MGKKNDKKLCWNCDGNVSLNLEKCPYCGVDLNKKLEIQERNSSLFQSSSALSSPSENTSYLGHPFQRSYQNDGIPTSPYGNLAVSEEEWNQALNESETENSESNVEEEADPQTNKSEMISLLLLLPGVVFFLFGLVLLFFSDNGVLTLQWNQSFAYFYFLGAFPLLILGWKALR